MAQKFPEVGLRAVFEIAGFQRAYSSYQRIMRDIDRQTKQTAQQVTQSGKDMGSGFVQSMNDLINQSKILEGALTSGGLSARGFEFLRDAFDALGQGVGINVERFDELIMSGSTLGEAFSGATGVMETMAVDADDLQKMLGSLAQQMLVGTAAVAGLTAALGASVKLVKQSLSEYTELAEATRQLHYQTGILTVEASGLVQAMQASGLSTASSARAMTSFLSKIEDMRREQSLGEESTSDFAKAIGALQISLETEGGALKSTEQLLGEVNVAFQNLGPSAKSAQIATDLFGYSGRFLLPILTDQKQSLADYMTTVERFGATLSALDREQYEEFRRANLELKAAIQGVYNYIATNWIPVLTQVARIVANVISIYRQLIEASFNVGGVQEKLVDHLTAAADGLEVLNRNISVVIRAYETLIKILNPARVAEEAMRKAMGDSSQTAEQLAQAEEEAAQKRAQASAAAVNAAETEEALRKKREETLQQLDKLKGQLNQKLGDIDADAKQRWEDILVNRQRDAMDRALQLAWRLDDLRAAYNDRLDAIERDFAKRWDDILVKRQRDAIERAMRLAWQYEDLARATEQRRADVLRDYAEREVEQRNEVQKRIRDLERDAQEKREDLEREHQRRLRDIQQDFLDTAQEAARRNDAVAVARAMRERARAIRDEEQRYQDSQRDMAEDLARRREEIERDRQEREADQRQELERALRRIEENYQRQLQELARQQERERIMREQQYRWEREDFEKAKAEQFQAAQEAYDKQIEELEKAQRREEILRRIQYERQHEDFMRNWLRRILDARQWYQRERDDLAAHLNYTAQQLEQAYMVWMQQAATAAAAAARTIAVAWASEISRYQQYLSGGTGGTGTGSVGKGRLYMAEGGVVEASSPTTIVMGERGPETGVFLPGRASSLSVNHNFGKLGVDFQGLPAGMNTQQVQSIVYAVMTQLAKGIQIPR